MQIEREIRKRREKIEEYKNIRSKAEGALEATMKKMKEEFGIANLKEAENTLETLENELEKIKTTIQEKIQEFDQLDCFSLTTQSEGNNDE